MFNISYVVVTVRARLVGFDGRWRTRDGPVRQRAHDLLARDLPADLPGILAAALLAFALSIDDYVITLFNADARSRSPVGVRRQRLGIRPRSTRSARSSS